MLLQFVIFIFYYKVWTSYSLSFVLSVVEGNRDTSPDYNFSGLFFLVSISLRQSLVFLTVPVVNTCAASEKCQGKFCLGLGGKSDYVF